MTNNEKIDVSGCYELDGKTCCLTFNCTCTTCEEVLSTCKGVELLKQQLQAEKEEKEEWFSKFKVATNFISDLCKILKWEKAIIVYKDVLDAVSGLQAEKARADKAESLIKEAEKQPISFETYLFGEAMIKEFEIEEKKLKDKLKAEKEMREVVEGALELIIKFCGLREYDTAVLEIKHTAQQALDEVRGMG